MTTAPLSRQTAAELQSMDLEDKLIYTDANLWEWYHAWDGKCYVSFSGGKDSTVLAYLAAEHLNRYRTVPYPLVLVFVNTGLEYPEIQHFVDWYAAWLRRQFPRVEIQLVRLRPKMNIKQVLTRYGYPVISKAVSKTISGARGPEGRYKTYALRLLNGEVKLDNGKKSMYNVQKWEFLIDAPFSISNRCCDIMKKNPSHRFERLYGVRPITAEMAEESQNRMQKWLQTGCNAFDGKSPKSKPMSFWLEQDVLRLIKDRNLPICSVYGDIVYGDGENDYDAALAECPLHCTGCTRTGCMPCMFGVHLEKGENRFQRMRHTHPKHYRFCIEGGAVDPSDGLWKPDHRGLGMGKVLDYIGVENR